MCKQTGVLATASRPPKTYSTLLNTTILCPHLGEGACPLVLTSDQVPLPKRKVNQMIGVFVRAMCTYLNDILVIRWTEFDNRQKRK
jgi:hypothetical protein